MQEVKSSAFTHVGHDPDTNVLTIRFNSGKEAKYHNFPAEKHAEFMASSSLGGYFAKNIRNNPEHNEKRQEVA